MKNFGLNDLNGQMMINTETNVVSYVINDYEEPIRKDQLRKIKSELGGSFTLITNAGVDGHSSELRNNVFENITTLRYNGINIKH